MSNYQRCNIRIYPNNGKIDLAEFRGKIEQLKIENNIYETIEIYYPGNLKFAEVRFTAKHYPSMLTDIFKLHENDIWIIYADEGGCSDFIKFDTRNHELFGGFHEKAVYTFDEVRLYGNAPLLGEKIAEIFGEGIERVNKHEIENGIKVHLNCLYTGNSFYYNKEEGAIKIDSFDHEVKEALNNKGGEFWDMLFHVDGIRFKENFYRPALQASTGIRNFEHLERIAFYDKKRLTNSIEWTEDGAFKYWKHSSSDGFWNCGNSRFYAYTLYRN